MQMGIDNIKIKELDAFASQFKGSKYIERKERRVILVIGGE